MSTPPDGLSGAESRHRTLAADVLIVGAGPAGSATALALVQAGVDQVLLADRPTGMPLRIGESAAPGVGPSLRRLGILDDLEELGHLRYHGNLSGWGNLDLEVDDFLHRGVGHGWHLDRAAFDGWIRALAVERGARLISPAALEAIARSATGGWCVRLRRNDHLVEATARVVVDATGRCATVAARLGGRRHRLDSLIALATTATPAPNGGLCGFSLVEAVETGWWYAAPVPGGRAVVTLMTDHDLARTGGLRRPAVFREAWAATRHLSILVPPPADTRLSVAVFSAATQYIDRAAGPGWLAVGDALVGLDPLTSSGISGALEDGFAAAETIVSWLSGAKSSGGPDTAAYAQRADGTLRRYLAERRVRYACERRWSESPFWSRRAALRLPNLRHQLPG